GHAHPRRLCRPAVRLDEPAQTHLQHPERHWLGNPRLHRLSSVSDRLRFAGSDVDTDQHLRPCPRLQVCGFSVMLSEGEAVNRPVKAQESKLPRQLTDWLLILGFCAFLFGFGLNYIGLIGADEPRYAQIAREMLARHDWVTPVLGGKPWLEKPALYYWQAMLSYIVFGVSDWAARMPSVVDATLMVVAVYLFLRKF